MFLVVSYWEPFLGREAEFEAAARKVAAILRKQPGVMLLETFKSGKKVVSVHGYRDEATYNALIDDPRGTFAKAVAVNRLEEFGTWLGSERGVTLSLE